MRKIEIDSELLQELYVEQGLTSYQIADELGVSRQTVCNKLKEQGFSVKQTRFQPKPVKKPRLKRTTKKLDYRNKQDFKKIYKELKTLDKLASFFGINQKTAFNWKKAHGIESERISYNRQDSYKPWTDRELLEREYASKSSIILAQEWNCDPSTIQKWLKRFGISRLTESEQWARASKCECVRLSNGVVDLESYYEFIESHSAISNTVATSIRVTVGKCQSCGYDQTLDLHHIDEDRTNNKPENHVILCPNCHALIHRLGKTVEELCPNYESWADILESYSEAK